MGQNQRGLYLKAEAGPCTNVHPIPCQTVNQTALIGRLENLEFQVGHLEDEKHRTISCDGNQIKTG